MVRLLATVFYATTVYRDFFGEYLKNGQMPLKRPLFYNVAESVGLYKCWLETTVSRRAPSAKLHTLCEDCFQSLHSVFHYIVPTSLAHCGNAPQSATYIVKVISLDIL